MALTKEDVGLNIKKARKKRSDELGYKYTQKALAKDTGISPGFISDIESGRSFPSTPAAMSIAEACGVSLDLIMGAEKGQGNNKPEAFQKIKQTVSEFLDVVYLPVIGDIPAGKPLLMEENIETYLPYSKEFGPDHHFVLRVQGDSMKDAGIFDGNLVVIRQQPVAENGQIVAARLYDDGVTLKKIHYEDDKIRLDPCNDEYQSIELRENDTIIGIAVSVSRSLIHK